MMINGRLLLLVAVTLVYVRVWTANDRPRPSAPSRPRSQFTYSAWPPSPGPAYPLCEVSSVSVAGPATSPIEEFWTAENCPILLPAGITSGAYRVVDDSGRVARLEIAALSPAENATRPVVQPEFSMTTNGSRRWYFIRLQTPIVEPSVAETPVVPNYEAAQSATVEVSQSYCMNRKFDFTGYETSIRTDDSQVEEIARPEPPDLPVPR